MFSRNAKTAWMETWRGTSVPGSTRKKSRKRKIWIVGTGGTQTSICSNSWHICMQFSRTVEAGRHLRKWSSAAPCSKQGYSQLSFELPPRMKIPQPLCVTHSSVQCLITVTGQECFLMFKWIFQLVPIASCLHWALLRRVWFHLFNFPTYTHG